ncbi:hypothetical protein C7402_15214 [Paraburkholderia unamae]|uniref:Lactonase family protein with 7-bladed beta-propeller n=3 Tax=Paraburkholderia unamae TaxID=219649 RepID=A0ABX5K5S4_9BURK|nr:hypothetical protein C7402_15214 [Paraburkholderia unamae]RAR47684.1 hypothetical protein C7401_16114 [Paraburkholderia unamae]
MEASRSLSAFSSYTGLPGREIGTRPSRFMRHVAYGAALFALSLASARADDLAPILPPSSVTSSTIPANGDLNPYGIAFVPAGVPSWSALKPGDVVVSNFNAKSNLQGTGTTIVKIVPNATPVTFFEGHNLGLTTALAVLRSGVVLVGNVPTKDGKTVIAPGSLLVINAQGRLIRELKDARLLDGPWDLAVIDGGQFAKVFVSDVLNGTVARIDLAIGENGVTTLPSSTIIASGYVHRTDPAALVVGPTGLAYDPQHDVLYVASTGDNAVFAVYGAAGANHDGGMGRLIYQDSTHLHGPLALALAPNGHLVTANGDAVNADAQQPSEIVEFTVDGQFVAEMSVDSTAGSAFGLAFGVDGKGHSAFAAVDDNTNTATVWMLRANGP